MQDYMKQDGLVTVALWNRSVKEAALWDVPIEDPNPPARKDCIELEPQRASPLALKPLREWASEKWPTWTSLEADGVLGILGTHKTWSPARRSSSRTTRTSCKSPPFT